jgi:hypothetical protein
LILALALRPSGQLSNAEELISEHKSWALHDLIGQALEDIERQPALYEDQ